MDSISHCEIPYDDQARAQKFYETVFGWQIAKIPDMDYYWITATETDPKTMVPVKPGAINGGMWKRQHDEKPVIVVAVKSVDEHLKKIAAAGGGVVLPKMQVGNHGFYAQVSDTEGNTIGIWQSAAGH